MVRGKTTDGDTKSEIVANPSVWTARVGISGVANGVPASVCNEAVFLSEIGDDGVDSPKVLAGGIPLFHRSI